MAPTVPIEFAGQKESKRCSISRAMGKSKKFSSKGLSAGFIPDFRHAVETMAESEGFGSSGRIDTEMTASDDSSAPKRKCISLNVDGRDNFGIPLQALSLAKMSRPERKDLKMRLKKELGQIESLQRRLASIPSDMIAQSPFSDIHSWSDGQKRPHLESSEISARNGIPKKRGVSSNNGSRSKKGSVRRPDHAKVATPAGASNSSWIKQCEALLNRLMTHNFSWVFNSPVDIVELNIPDYFNVIKHPMDLGTVKSKLTGGEYSSPSSFAADVRLTFSNAMTYNPRGNDVHFMAGTLNKNFETRWKSLEKKINAVDVIDAVPAHPANSGTRIETEVSPLKKKKIVVVDECLAMPLLEKRTMCDEEKHKLSMELESLLGELPESIVDFLKEQSSVAEQTNADDEIEIDIDALGDDTLFKLRSLLDDYLLEKQKKLTKAEPCEPELCNESGVSNLLLPPGKGNDANDEDVDIVGGNDPPISSSPPVMVEKDAARRNSKCVSSSSSGSESGSSSSDSDSGSSSAGEADVAKVAKRTVTAKEGLAHGISQQYRHSAEYFDGGPDVENPQPNSVSADVGICHDHEEENAQSERQVSPEKLYRAALLRSRFADTILKAREKALEKGDKLDPEKLRMEKEELDRRAKEEKARIQAEAKVAEEARKRAEAKVAAEAKRKRELERELARQALQKMEKTVNINENSEFMEDLEMLRITQVEDVPNLLEEPSPELFEKHLGNFKLQSNTNPLEQLGLYMKVEDEEEEEEGGPSQSVVDTQTKDVGEGVEEGGID